MEGDTLKGVFFRKDNGKQLTTTRSVQGDELTQVRTVHVRGRGYKEFMAGPKKPLCDLLSSELQLRRRGRKEDF